MKYYISKVPFDANYLEHFGILGMKWGQRNGPPYPLGAQDHSAAEKKAGWRKSLEDGGATRKPNNPAKIEKKKPARATKEKDKHTKPTQEFGYDQKMAAKVGSESKKFSKLGEELITDYTNYYGSLINNNKFKNTLYSRIYKQFSVIDDEFKNAVKSDLREKRHGGAVSDDEIWRAIISIVVDDVVKQFEPAELRTKVEDFYSFGDKFLDMLATYLVDPAIKKYEATDIMDLRDSKNPSKEEIAEINKFFKNSDPSVIAYVYGRFNPNAREALIQSFDLEDYDKWAVKRK